MKKLITVILSVVIILSVFSLTASAQGNILANDKFIAVIPENFEIYKNSGYDHYYLQDAVSYSGNIEIFVEGNFLFPEGIKKASDDVISKRIADYLYNESMYENVEMSRISKEKINGITVGRFAALDGSENLFGYIYTTEQTLFIALYSTYNGDEEPENFIKFIENFYVNGTHYDGEKLSVNVDFSKEIHYIDALERDVFTEEYYDYNSGVGVFAVILVLICILAPIAGIVFLILFIITRKKLNEYKNFFGSIEAARGMMNNYAAYQSNGQYYGMYPQNLPNNGQYYPAQQPQQTQYQQYPQYSSEQTAPAQVNEPTDNNN